MSPLPEMLFLRMATWKVLGITQMRLYFSRILITDPQHPSNFAKCHAHEMNMPTSFTPPFWLHFIIFTSTLLLYAIQFTHLI